MFFCSFPRKLSQEVFGVVPGSGSEGHNRMFPQKGVMFLVVLVTDNVAHLEHNPHQILAGILCKIRVDNVPTRFYGNMIQELRNIAP